jgi:hypothetical protein
MGRLHETCNGFGRQVAQEAVITSRFPKLGAVWRCGSRKWPTSAQREIHYPDFT